MLNAINRIFCLDKHHHPIDKIAKINALLSGIALYPQLFKIIFTADVTGFSLLTYILIALNSLVWIFYAVHRKLVPLLISSVLNLLAAFGISIFIVIK
ncbi:MAG: PQ-loop domain-containing transporter [Patescibacteria group bacterium]